jgi:membrane protein implicated in regulation of membrane protease activity
MIDQFPPLDSDPELWLSALADDELDPAQRGELVLWVEQHPAWWRNCAIALLDQQVMRRGVQTSALADAAYRAGPGGAAGLGTGKPMIVAASPVSEARFLPWLTSSLAVTLLAVVAAASAIWWQASERRAKLSSELNRSREICQQLATELGRRTAVNRALSLAQLYPDHRVLVEIDDSPSRTVYLTDQPVSDLLLESFVAAGHDVEVQPYEPRYQTQSMRQLRNPVLAVEVRKSGLILTSLEDLQ